MNKQAERRNLLAQLFVVLLIGLAYQEMIAPVRESIRQEGISVPTLCLFLVFFLTSLRFFIGAQLHLVDERVTRLGSGVWFFDFMFIAFEMIIFIFLGGLTSLAANLEAKLDFFELLILIYAVDILWVALQIGAAAVIPAWRREVIPWKWAAINVGSLVILLPTYYVLPSPFSICGLAILLLVNVAAFVLDVFVVDYFSIVRQREAPTSS